MGIMVYSLFWVVQDFVHQPYGALTAPSESSRKPVKPRSMFLHAGAGPHGCTKQVEALRSVLGFPNSTPTNGGETDRKRTINVLATSSEDLILRGVRIRSGK